jgi:hypothetical protein
MKWIFAAALAAALPLSAQGYGNDKKEMKDDKKTSFELTDTDGDNVVTLDEAKQHRKEMRDAWIKAGEADDWVKACEECVSKYERKLSIEKFLRYDTNDDLKLTKQEFTNATESAEPKLSEADRKQFSDVHFDEWAAYAGTTGDAIDVSGYRDAMAKRRAAISAEAAPDNPQQTYAKSRTYSVLKDYRKILIADANKDGRVTRAESQALFNAKFDGKEMELDAHNQALYAEQLYLDRIVGLDGNDDGVLTRDEVAIAEDAPSDEEWAKLDKDSNDSLSKDEIRSWPEPTEDELKAARREAEKEKEKEHETPEPPKD